MHIKYLKRWFHTPTPGYKDILLYCFLKISVLITAFHKSLIQLQLIFMYKMSYGSSFIFSTRIITFPSIIYYTVLSFSLIQNFFFFLLFFPKVKFQVEKDLCLDTLFGPIGLIVFLYENTLSQHLVGQVTPHCSSLLFRIYFRTSLFQLHKKLSQNDFEILDKI